MNIRKCSIEDTDLIISTGKETYFDTFQKMNSRETMAKYLEEAFEKTKIINEIENPDSHFYIVSIKNETAAYLKINYAPAQTDINDPDSLEIERIYVRKFFKGRGIGKELINFSIDKAKETNCSYTWLGVWEKNEAAIAFYKKRGFSVFATHKFKMGDELQSDLLLKKIIQQ